MDVTPYILVLFLKQANAGGLAFQEFIGKAACEEAAEQIEKKWDTEKAWASKAFTICVPK
jgi:hypothetical protein